LAKRWEAWGLAWEKRLAAGGRFHWHEVEGQPVNQRILPLLKQQTQDHCSFCDNYPVSPPSIDTIEHFRPKARYPREAYRWGNLYFACMYCQGKGDAFDESALQPDAADYSFDRYFRWDWTRGTLEVNERASAGDQQRARATIALYRLNDGHPGWRRRELRRRARANDEPLDDFAYRDYVAEPKPDVAVPAAAS
jgi:uncharacterized protein (TIGR02646 family)